MTKYESEMDKIRKLIADKTVSDKKEYVVTPEKQRDIDQRQEAARRMVERLRGEGKHR